jgi:hypothetical protein
MQIEIADQPSRQVREAAELVTEYLGRTTGVPLTSRGGRPVTLHIGPTAYARTHVDLDGLVEDGYVISASETNHICLLGPSDWGTEYAVYAFLERYADVRWLLPGPYGEDVPAKGAIAVPAETVRQQPAFLSRTLSGLRGAPQTTWARRLRLRGTVNFHHNLHALLPVARLRALHPEWFPPAVGSASYGWQPCFSAKGVVDATVDAIIDYCRAHPGTTSVSLGINDSHNWCPCSECGTRGGTRTNFLGFRDWSDVYYPWANAVVEAVLKHLPHLWFGCLAYQEVAEPPRLPVHPRLVPYLTADRLQWATDALRIDAQALQRRWQAKAASLGWYDYVYGTPYCVPRVYFSLFGETARYAHEHGVVAQYAEAYPNWGEGPKLYALAKLWWDPAHSVQDLVEEWCVRAVGRAAADPLLAYYRLWERFWTVRVLQSNWWPRELVPYLPFADPRYLMAVADEISESEKLLAVVVAKAETEAQRYRAVQLHRAFSYYEASVMTYSKRPSVVSRMGRGARRKAIVDAFEEDPLLKHPLRFDTYRTLRW